VVVGLGSMPRGPVLSSSWLKLGERERFETGPFGGSGCSKRVVVRAVAQETAARPPSLIQPSLGIMWRPT